MLDFFFSCCFQKFTLVVLNDFLKKSLEEEYLNLDVTLMFDQRDDVRLQGFFVKGPKTEFAEAVLN